MKLLIVTQAVDTNDPVLGFFVRWIEEFALHAERIEVICLAEGKYALPKNVRVHSLGKERRPRSRFAYAVTFLKLVWQLRRDYDTVFVHMNPEYLVLAGWFWRIWGKKVGLWYTHGTVSWRLRIAVRFAHLVFTASEESMRVPTRKKRVTGHGLDLERFPLAPDPASTAPYTLMTVGRTSRVKRSDLLKDAVAKAQRRGAPVVLSVIENTPHDQIPSLLAQAHLFLHASATGSLDKAPLEALATGLPVITTNAELASAGNPAVLGAAATSEAIAARITEAVQGQIWAKPVVRHAARRYVEEHHEIRRLIERISRYLQA